MDETKSDNHLAYLNIFEDIERHNKEMEEAQLANLNIMEDLDREKKELKQTKAFVENIIKSMKEMMVVISPDGTIEMANQATLEMLKYEKEDLIGNSITALFDDRTFIESILNNDHNERVDKEIITSEGEKIPVLFSRSFLTDSKGNISKILCVASDIADRKKMEMEIKGQLKETTSQLVQSSKLSTIGELTAGICHELNQPFNIISMICHSSLRSIEKDKYTIERNKRNIEEIKENIKKAAEIIDHMRLFSRSDMPQNYQGINLNEIIERAVKFMNMQLKVHEIELSTILSDNLAHTSGDPIRIEQVLLNLVTNARNVLKDMDKENKKIEITTKLSDDSAEIIMAVSDNGPGISKEIKDKIFDPFFTTRAPGEGTGLGLSITSKIMNEHNGRINLISEEGKGASFQTFWPVKK